MGKNTEKKAQEQAAPEEISEGIAEDVLKQAKEAGGINAELESLKQQAEEFKDSALRAAAEAENIRKRAAKEVDEANKYGVSSIAKDLISVVENLQRALDAIPEEAKSDGVVKNLYDGVDLTKKELLSIFERRGIKRIEPQVGDKFDHNFHQAMAQVEDPKFEAGCIINSMQSGYVIHDRLLRPAMVVVSKGGPAKPTLDTSA